MMRANHPAKWEKFVWPVLLVAVLSILWQQGVKWTGSKIFPSPLDVERGLAELMHKGILWGYIRDSLRRVAMGFGLATFLGIPAGLTLGWYPGAAQVVNPVIQILRPISPIAWIPLSIVWFGVGDAAAIYLTFLGAFFPIVIASMNGVRNVPTVFRRAGRNFGLGTGGLLMKVVFPAALP
jgi:NitT/TauT family transport system permease protein